MALRDCDFKVEYRTGSNNLVEDLYHLALPYAAKYWRAVGYFSSTALEAIGQPLGDFIYRGGEIRLITSVELQEEDVEAIKRGLSKREACEHRILEQIRSEFAGSAGRGAALLSALLEVGRLDIRIAMPETNKGIYHEKVGIFIDDMDEFVAFTGSSNESKSALEMNYECIDVFPSWKDPERALLKKQHFELLWNGKLKGAATFEFPEAAKRELIRICKAKHITNIIQIKENQVALWEHQEHAIEQFLKHRRGILEMATGTGKTRTALEIIKRLVISKNINSVIVCSDGTDLLEQWSKQLYEIASTLEPRFRVLQHFAEYHQRDEYELEPNNSILIISRLALHSLLHRMRKTKKDQLLIIHDEVHGLGSPANIKSLEGLSEDIPFRLGMSATPERTYDQEGTSFIEMNVGPIIYQFPLENAIREGILCGFDYYPLEYQLTEDDKERLQNVFRIKAAREAEGNPMSDPELWTALARIHKTSPTKLPLFRTFLARHPEALERCIVFVAEREYGEKVLEIVHHYRYDFHTYYAEDDRKNLDEFARGGISCLVTCHRLSEGIDIKSVRSIVLFASDRAKLETIQRIGRCLRTDPSNTNKRAMVVDFVRAQDTTDPNPNTDQARSAWLSSLSQIRRRS